MGITEVSCQHMERGSCSPCGLLTTVGICCEATGIRNKKTKKIIIPCLARLKVAGQQPQ